MFGGSFPNNYAELIAKSTEAILKLSELRRSGASSDVLADQAKEINEAKKALGLEPIDIDVLVSGCTEKFHEWEQRQEKVDARRFRTLCQMLPPAISNELRQRADAVIADKDGDVELHVKCGGSIQ